MNVLNGMGAKCSVDAPGWSFLDTSILLLISVSTLMLIAFGLALGIYRWWQKK